MAAKKSNARKSKAPAPKKVKKKAGSRSAKPRSSGGAGGPRTVSTGRGPSAQEIGESLVSLCNAGKWDEPCRKWWDKDIESIEGIGMSWRGRDAGLARAAEWHKQNLVHGGSAEGPYVGATGFSVKFRLDYQERSTGTRWLAEEVGVYTVKDGRIIREEFMYGQRTEQVSKA